MSVEPISPPTVLCVYPEKVLEQMQRFSKILRASIQDFDTLTGQYFIQRTVAWNNGATVSIAFLGGDTTLHQKIATVATTWTEYANLEFDFGLDPDTGTYRTWTREDNTYSANIRISFDDQGYWSLLGTASSNLTVVKPSEASMNFNNFDQQLPDNWEAVVLHEFGHAIGFHHEHQHPTGACNDQYRWQDDPGYEITPLPNSLGIPCVFAVGDRIVADRHGKKPGLYRILGGWPNYWSMCVIDQNIRQIHASDAFLIGPFDSESIMKYRFPAYMYHNGEQSRCYSESNYILSEGDKEGASEMYPQTISVNGQEVATMGELIKGALTLENPPEVQTFLQSQLTRFGS